jgi:hypothetical protein
MSHFPYVQVAGDTLDFEVDVPDYPSTDGWTLKYRLIPQFTTPTQAPITITASGNADGTYQVQQGPTDTANWQPGAYGWSRWVEKVGARQTLTSSHDQGEVQIQQNPATAVQGYDTRSHARKMLEAIEACLVNRASTTQRELVAYTIGSRSQTFDSEDSRARLEELADKYRWKVANEDNRAGIAAGQKNQRDVRMRFGRA